jgi:hypothetical protein
MKTQESFINGQPRYQSSFPLDELEEDEHEEGALGRPKERTKYNTDKHVRDRDPIGKKSRGKGRDADRTVRHKYKHGSPLARESKLSAALAIKNQMPTATIKNIIKESFGKTDKKQEPRLLDEQNLIDLD